MLPLDPYAVLIAFTVLIVSLSVHEGAHAWSADLFGDPTPARLGRLTLNPLAHIDPIGTILFPLVGMVSGLPIIGWARPVPVGIEHLGPHWRRKFALIAAAGPASNIVLALLASLLLRIGLARTETGLDLTTGRLLYMGLTLNVTLAVFNMLPVPPLDGGNVLAGMLPGPVATALDKLRPFGFLILYALLLTGILATVVLPVADAIIARLD